MDQDRQMLGTDPQLLTLVNQSYERYLVAAAFTM
jgi:hypothetical protein